MCKKLSKHYDCPINMSTIKPICASVVEYALMELTLTIVYKEQK